MKSCSFLILFCALFSGHTAFAFTRCDLREVSDVGRDTERSWHDFERFIERVPSYRHLSYGARQLGEEAYRLAQAADRGADCWELEQDFDRYVKTAFTSLQREHAATQQRDPDEYVRQQWRRAADDYRRLQTAVTGVAPGACPQLVGSYQGTCRADGGGTSGIGFGVTGQGNSCVVTASSYFYQAPIYVRGNVGEASPQGAGANSNISVTVYGRGQFNVRGYNNAGKFWFTCTQ